MRPLVLALATGCGAGLSPVAPGTAGSVVGIAAALGLARLGLGPWATAAALTVCIVISCWIAGRAETEFAEHDSGRIVIDEICGMMVALAFSRMDLASVVVGFAVFRFLDVAKPWPAHLLQARLHGGWAVVLDDVAVGVWTSLALRVLV